MRRTAVILALVVVAAAAVGAWRWRAGTSDAAAGDLVLYGNVDLREVQLAFQGSERIVDVVVQEGDRVEADQVVARLETARIRPRLDEARAQADAARQVVTRLRNGSRPEEIERAKADVEARRQVVERLRNGTRPQEIEAARAAVAASETTAANAKRTHDRLVAATTTGDAVSRQDVEDAKAALDVAEAKAAADRSVLDLLVAGPRAEEIAEAEAQLAATEKTLALLVAGPREEEIEEAEARLRAAEAHTALLERELADAELKAPLRAVVRTRLAEPGDMASPSRPVLTLAVTDPKWVRAYVTEPDLVRVRPGGKASITVDGFPGRAFDGRIGFVSSVAEFTPKPVQTEELRTSLVYEVRVFVFDPDDDLRLGMPATVRVSAGAAAADGAPHSDRPR